MPENLELPAPEKKELTNEQKVKVLEFWNSRADPPSLGQLVELIYGPNVSAKSEEGWVIRRFLASKKLVAKKTLIPKKEEIILTPEQEEYIVNNCASNAIVEMAKVLFNNPLLTGTSKESLAVRDFCQKLSNKIKTRQEKIIEQKKEELLEEETQENGEVKEIKMFRPEELEILYTPPKNRREALERINKYTKGLDKNKIGPKQEKIILSVLNNLNSHQFIAQISTYINKQDVILFESSFISQTYDKPDLSEDEVYSYLMLITEIILGKNILRRMEEFQSRLDENLNNDDKMFQAVVDAAKSLQDSHDKCVKRQTQILKDLTGTRKDRIEGQIAEKSSLVQLFEYFKDYESRQNMIRLAEIRKKALKDEIERLETMDALKIQVFGLDKNEVLNS